MAIENGARGRGESTTSPRRLEAVDRQARALELRKSGWSYARIAAELGYSGPSGAFEAVRAGLDSTLRPPAEELRRLELERLDALQTAIWDKAMAADLGAIDRALKLSERRCRLLGLDALPPPVDPAPAPNQEWTLEEERELFELASRVVASGGLLLRQDATSYQSK